jgi:hypothetical protein
LANLQHIDGKTDPQKLAQQVIALSQELNNRRHNGTTAEIDEEKKVLWREEFSAKLCALSFSQ